MVKRHMLSGLLLLDIILCNLVYQNGNYPMMIVGLVINLVVLSGLFRVVKFEIKDLFVLSFVLYVAFNCLLVGYFSLMGAAFFIVLLLLIWLAIKYKWALFGGSDLFPSFVKVYAIVIAVILCTDVLFNSSVADVYTRYSLNLWPYKILDSSLALVLPFVLFPFVVMEKSRTFFWLAVILCVVSVVYLQRRGPLAVLLLGIIIHKSSFLTRVLKNYFWLPFAVMFTIIMAMSKLIPELLIFLTGGIREVQNTSNETRLVLYLYSMNSFFDFSLVNVVFGDLILYENFVERVRFFHPHNVFLYLLTGHGILGLLQFLNLMSRAARARINYVLPLLVLLYVGLTESAFNNFGLYTCSFFIILLESLYADREQLSVYTE